MRGPVTAILVAALLAGCGSSDTPKPHKLKPAVRFDLGVIKEFCTQAQASPQGEYDQARRDASKALTNLIVADRLEGYPDQLDKAAEILDGCEQGLRARAVKAQG